jgi:recombination/repair/ssDNA binding protein UvsY
MPDNEKNEVSKLKTYELQVKQLENDLDNEVESWKRIINKLTTGIKGTIQKLPEVESDVLNNKQLVDSDIRKYSLVMYKDVVAMKPLRKKRFEFYSTSYQLKVKNGTDIKMLTESDLAKIQYKIDLLDTHIDFLRDTSANLKTLGYSVKNRIELLTILGLD